MTLSQDYLSGNAMKVVFVKEHRLVQHVGERDLTTSKVQDAEGFVCKLFRVENVTKTDKASVTLFNKWKTLEVLPPPSDALHGQIVRAQYQNLIWRQSDL